MLVIITLLALSMFRSFGLQERIAGNTREKQRSLQTAQSALQYAEWWLNWYPNQSGNSIATITTGAAACSGSHYNANTVANMVVCSNALPSTAVTDLTWPGAGDYSPPTINAPGGGGVASNGDINYLKPPSSVYIQYLGLNGQSYLFLVTAVGYGGSVDGASVLQSTYSLTSCTGCASSLGGAGGGFSTNY
jgi:type IV pilus assembly protein PilX